MDIESLKSALTARRGAVATVAIAVAAVGAVAWAVSSGPLVPASPAAGSGAGSAARTAAPATAGSSLPAAPGGAPDGAGAADGDAGQQGDDEQQGAGAPSPADGGGEKGDSGRSGEKPSEGRGRGPEPKPQHHASAPDPGKPGKPAPQKPSPAPAPEPERPSRPAHTHSWSAVYRDEPVYGQQWVSKWEDVYTRHERYRCTTCGATYYSLGEMNAHLDSTIDWDAMTGHAGYLDDSYTTVEKVDKGSSQTVQTGTKKVLDHYECACGARK